MVVDIRKYFTVANDMKEARKNLPKKFLVTEVAEKKTGFINPVIVSFQNGTVNDQQLSDFKVRLTANKNGETNVEVETSYGHVFKDSNATEIPRPKQIIAIRNRKTNKVKVVECDSATLINSVLLCKPEITKTESDYKKELKNLNRTFGGKKFTSILDQREKLNISAIPVADEVKKAVEEIKVEDSNTSVNDTESESLLHLLPPCHRDATTVSNVYLINEILSDEELIELQKEVENRKENKFNTKDYSEFYMHCYSETIKTSENLDIRLAGILFAEILIQFLKTPHKKLTAKRVVLCEFSSIIHDKILNEFCLRTDSSISRPMTMRDKCLCYIITICLICCGYRLNMKLLSTTVGLNFARLIRLTRLVGAVPAAKDDANFVLKLPLPPLPKASNKRIRKK